MVTRKLYFNNVIKEQCKILHYTSNNFNFLPIFILIITNV